MNMPSAFYRPPILAYLRQSFNILLDNFEEDTFITPTNRRLPGMRHLTSEEHPSVFNPSYSRATHTISAIPTVRSYTNVHFDAVFNQASQDNSTVYCKGLNLITASESLFSPFGVVEEINFYVGRPNYALIRFNTQEAATRAICSLNNSEIDGCRITCTWHNEPNLLSHQAQATTVDQPPTTTSAPQLSSEADCLLSSEADCLPFALPGVEEKVIEKSSDILCKICMDEELGVVFLPCGHLVTCPKCAERIFNCPLCRKSITQKIRTYLS